MQRQYIAIDLKSFYASVECRERNLDPLTTNLVVADMTRTEKTIGLAVSPSLKSFGVPGRPRMFEVVQKVREANNARKWKAPGKKLVGESYFYNELMADPSLEITYLVAPPRMALYMEYSTRIYDVYLKYVAPEDIFAYSIDEVFIDATYYLNTYKMGAHELAMTMIRDVLATTGITATAGIGSNMYLAKIAMDIKAKKMQADKDGVRIAELDEITYRKELWEHKPLTAFWRVGSGYASKLEANGMYTMGDVARMSLSRYGENLLYKLFGVNAELLIDHAWGWEPCTMEEVKAYKPSTNSISSGQVLSCPYNFEKARLIVREMTDLLVLDLVEKGLVTDQIVLTIGYDIECLTDPDIRKYYHGPVTTDHYGRPVPKHAHGTANMDKKSSSTKKIMEAVTALYDRIVDVHLLVRRVTIAACKLERADAVKQQEGLVGEQLTLFMDLDNLEQTEEEMKKADEREKAAQKMIIEIHKKYGKNAIMKGMNLEEGATSMERNRQIGGHRA